MYKFNFYVEFARNMLGCMLGRVYRAMLAAGASVCYHQARKTTFDVPLYRTVDQGITMLKECSDFAILLKEIYHLLVQACECFIAVVFAGIVDGTTVKYISATVSRRIVRYAFFIGKTHHANRQATCCVGKLVKIDKFAK